MTCPHGICYGLKWLLRQEGPRDHVDMLKSLAVLPNIIVCDIANMIVAHGRNRDLDVFGPNEGRVAEATRENIEKAESGELRVDWPWYPNGVHGQVDPFDSLRRVSCVRQLGGKMNLETAEQITF